MTVDVNDMGAPWVWFIDRQKNGTPDREVEGAVWWGQLRHARCAYDVVSFTHTQTSLTRLVVFGKRKSPEDFSRGLE